jgi:hypothetical protein
MAAMASSPHMGKRDSMRIARAAQIAVTNASTFVQTSSKQAVSYHSDRPLPRLICQRWFPVATIPPPRFLIEWLLARFKQYLLRGCSMRKLCHETEDDLDTPLRRLAVGG